MALQNLKIQFCEHGGAVHIAGRVLVMAWDLVQALFDVLCWLRVWGYIGAG